MAPVIAETQTLVAGKYQLIRRLAAGGMAEVLLARQVGLFGFEKLVVVKRVLPHLAERPAFVQMFLDEARTAADLRHPNVVSVLDVVAEGNVHYLVMEYLRGRDLRGISARLRRNGKRVPLVYGAQVVLDVAAGLHYAHTKTDMHGRELKLIHRDVSPSNILVTYDGTTKLLDFGVAKAKTQSSETVTGIVKGKWAYMSPEQALREPIDQRTDQFALGIVLWELSTGKRLFERDHEAGSMQAIIDCDVPKPSDVSSDYPPRLEPVVMKALSKNRDQRFESCAEFANALEEALASEPESRSATRLGAFVRNLFADELARDPEILPAPQGETCEEAYAKAPQQVLTAVSLRRPTNLAPPAPGFVGRAGDLCALDDLFGERTRLVTITGPGGMGKTRLATEFAYRQADAFSGGVWFCDLSEARDIDGIVSAFAQALDVPLPPRDEALVHLGKVLARRGKLLIVLDNFEQIVADAPATVGRWMAAAPEVHFLVTSRELLHLRGEQPYTLEPLGLPEEGQVESAAVELFLARGVLARRGFSLSPANASIVAEIVRRLEGIPLAIELAAARLAVLTPQQIADRMSNYFDLLDGSRRGGSVRAQDKGAAAKLRGTIDWSWNLLEEWERTALMQVSAFSGEFSLDAAEQVIAFEEMEDAPQIVDVFQALCEKSLLRTMDGPGSEPRFGMFVAIREYAAEKLWASGETAATKRRHTDYYLRLAADTSPRPGQSGRRDDLQRLALDRENLLAVHRWSMSIEPRTESSIAEAARALLALEPLLALRGPFTLHSALLSDTIDAAAKLDLTSSPTRRWLARLFEARGRSSVLRGRLNEARSDFERAVELAREIGDRETEGTALSTLGGMHVDLGDRETGIPLYREALAVQRAIGDAWGEAVTRERLALLYREDGALEQARKEFEHTLAVFELTGDRRSEALTLISFAILEHEEGHFDAARARYEGALGLAREIGDRRLEGIFVGYLGFVDHHQGKIATARDRYQRALSIIRDASDARYEGLFFAALGAAHAELDELNGAEAAFDQAEATLRAVEDSPFLKIIEVYRGLLDLARARAAGGTGNHREACELNGQANLRLEQAEKPGQDGAPPLIRFGEEARFAVMCLRAGLGTTLPVCAQVH